MPRSAGLGAFSLVLFAGLAPLLGLGCGSSPPAEHDIWHTPALRPGQVAPASASEQQLLAQMSGLPSGEPVTIGGDVFVAGPPYAAASGRTCRTISQGTDSAPAGAGNGRLACEEGADWVFVPDVLDAGSW